MEVAPVLHMNGDAGEPSYANSSLVKDHLYVRQALLLKEAKVGFKKLISDDPMESLYMVDFVQSLGIEYLFEEEIESALQKQYWVFKSDLNNFVNSHPLYDVALTFRLLRQGGHHVNPDVSLDSFKINKRKFKEQYGEDVWGLIAMFEASQLSIEGEDILDDANYICFQLLQEWLTRHQDHHQAIHVANTLHQPLHHGLPRFMDKSIFLLNHFKANHNNYEWTCLQELAEINSCIVRLTNQNEVLQVFKWWKDLGMTKEEKFARYQPLKWYLWPMACFIDPHFSHQRIELTKPISLVYIIDDIFDVHGTLEQLTVFTDAVNRWEMTGTEQLPYFMRICLSALYDITNDFAEKIYKKHRLNPIDTLKNSWVQLLNAFLEEAHWLNSGHLPKSEKYLKNGIVSTGVHVVLLHAFFLFDHHITKETLAILNDFPDIILSVAKILRLSDDLEAFKSDEDQKGLDGSYLDCYMSEHQDISAEEAQKYVEDLISREWKRLNQQVLLTPNQFPSPFTNFCLNAARMVPLMYHYHSNNPCLTNLKEHIKLLVN